MGAKILLVDDDENLLAGLRRQLRHRFELQTAAGAYPALDALAADGPFSVVVSDMRMPVMNGVRFLSRVKEKYPDTVRIMLTGNADMDVAINAVNEGSVFHFLTKPCPPDTLIQALEMGIKQHKLVTSERELLEHTLHGSIRVLTEILSTADPEKFGRAELLRDQVRELAQHMNLPRIWELEIAAMLSNIGYMTVPTEIFGRLSRGIALSDEERNILLQIPEIASCLIANIPRLENVARMIRYQNRRFDGSDTDPDGIVGHSIPVGSRLLKVSADLVELKGKGKTQTEALETMRRRLGWYDPEILQALSECLPSVSMPATSSDVKPGIKGLFPSLTLPTTR